MDPLQIFNAHSTRVFPWVVFGCAVFENDVTFVMAGVYAASVRGGASPAVAIVAGVLGALCHDSFWFALGHNRSAWLKKTPAWKRLGPQVEAWAQRFGVRELFFARFLPGTRNVSVLFWGVQRLPTAIFLAVEAAALSIWGTALVMLGYLFGQNAETFFFRVKQKHLGRWMLLILLITLSIYALIRAFTKHEIVKHGRPPEDPRAD